jgi:hypothetical protein
VKFGVVDRWSISRPGVAIRISTFEEPPSSLLVSLVITQDWVTDLVSMSSMS